MNLQPKPFLRVLLSIVLLFGLTVTNIAQSKDGAKSVTDYTSIAKITGTAEGKTIKYTNPYTHNNAENFAGVFNGTLNGNAEKFYCIDLQHGLAFNEDYWDEGSTPSEITYVLNNYFPYKTSYSGKLSDNNEEAAAVQISIWHFSDGVDANTITNNSNVKNRALAIIADANANHNNNTTPVATLQIVPSTQTLPQGTPALFDIYALDGSSNGVSGVNISLSTNLGTLSTTTVITDANGHAGPVTLSYSGTGIATVSAEADVHIPQGTRYVHKVSPNTKQKLVLATPAFDTKNVNTTIEWETQLTIVRTDTTELCAENGQNINYNIATLIADVYSNGDVKIRLYVSKSLNDNTYGTNTIGWPGNNHTFSHLLNSDEAEFNLYNGNNNQVLNFTLDYLDDGLSTTSGYGAKITSGSSPYILNFNTSLARNFNDYGYILTTNSPATDANYTPNSSYPNWIFDMVYEFTISGSAFGVSGFGNAEVAGMHNSPDKLGFDNLIIPEICTPPCENKIGDYVWHDKDVDGIQDANEPGIANVVVELLDGSGNLITTTTTDANGKYEFANLANGTYKVRVASSNYASGGVLESTTQTKWYSTKKNQGSDDAKDSDANKNESVTVTLNCNDNLTIDFGFYKTCVSVIKTADKQTYEPGDVITYTFTVENCGDITLSGGVDFYDALLNPTAPHKIHNISPVNPGEVKSFTRTYTVKEEDCGDLVNTVTAIGHPIDGSANVEFTSSVTVFIDCTEPCLNKIGDYVWHDKDVDGIQDANEPGIANVVVELLDGSGNLITTTTTDANGKYEFANLANGTYKVRVASSNYASGGVLESTTQTKWYSTKKNQGSDDAKDSDANKNESVTVTLNCNDNLTIDFGFYKTCVSVIKTADKQTYEPGDVITYTFTVENCGDITLSGGVDFYDALLNPTAPHKIHNISPVNPGEVKSFTRTYTVKEEDCGDLVNTVKAVGHPIDGSANVEFTSSVTVFIDCTQPCLNKIGDFVWHDMDTDGVQDANEPGLANVIVELLDAQGNLLQVTATDNNGYYYFSNLPSATYKVRIAASNFTSGVLAGSQSEKWFLTFQNSGSDDAKDSDGDNNKTATVTVNCNEDLTIDFGFFRICVSLIKTGPASVNAGETITYSFTVTNCGDVLLSSGAMVYDPMLNPNGDHKIKDLELNPGESKTFTFDYETTTSDCGELINEAWVIGHPYLANYNFGGSTVRYEDGHTVTVICDEKEADLEINKTSSTTNPECGEQFYFTITLKNNGPDASEDIIVSDLLPSGAEYISHTTSQGTYNPATGLWNVGDLNSSATATLTIYVKVDCEQVNNSTFDLGVASDYNLFVIEDVDQPSSDTQGKVAVGGDANFANYSIGDQLPPNSGNVLIVGGTLTYTSGRVYNGNVVYGNSTNLPAPGVTVDGTISQGFPIDFAAAKTFLESLSLSLSGYTVNGTTTFQWGGLTLTGTDPFLNVFSVSGANLSAANNVSINVPNGSAVLVNIDGYTINWTGGLSVNGTAINNVLYNFYQATSITIQGIDIRGSILAPFADIDFAAGVINGQMICKSLTGMGQMNQSPFGGNIPGEDIINVAIIVSSITPDPNPNNNSDMVEVIVGGNDNGGNNGGNNDGDNNWQYVSGFGVGEIVYSMVFDGQNIYAGTWGGKIYKSSNNGQTWTVINAGMNVSFIWSLQISGGYIFAATEFGVYKFNGTSWSLTSLAGIDVHSLTVSGGVIYAGTWGLGVYQSTDNGTTWLPMNNGLSYFLTIQSVTATASGELFAASVGGGVFKYQGSVWVNINLGYNFVWTMNSSSNVIYAGTYGDGLYRSFDGGTTWSKVTTLNAPFIYSISVSGSGKVYVASWASGVFESTDNGNSWTSLGLGGFGVSSLMVPSGSEDVFVGTKEGQIYMAKFDDTATDVNDGLSEVPSEFELNQNYPNPFNPSTTIQFAVPKAGNYSVKVFNVLGQEVATLLNGEIGSGLHKVTFDAGNLSSGIYVYRLVGNNVNISKKMILTK